MGKKNKNKKKWKNKHKHKHIEPEDFVNSEQINILAHKVFGSLYYNSSSDITN